MSALWGLQCQDCDVRSPYWSEDKQAIRDILQLWPHIAALRACASLQIESEAQDVFGFVAQHLGHHFHLMNSQGESEPCGSAAADNPEVQRLWAALYYAAGVIDRYQAEIRKRPDLVAQDFCQSELYRDAVATITEIASGERTEPPQPDDGERLQQSRPASGP